jgi:hypothetical protein
MAGVFSVFFSFFLVVLRRGRRDADAETLASEIQDKTPEDVEKYLKVFNKKCKTLSGM